MKRSSFCTFLAFICSLGLISYVTAGPGASGDHGRPAGVGGGPSSGSGPEFSQDNNPGQQGQTASDGTRFNSDDNPGKTGSAFGHDRADSGSSGISRDNPSAIGRGESVSETSNREFGEQASSEKSENSSKDQTFKASLMDSGLKASESDSGPPGTPPGHHYGWEKGKYNPHRSPSPSATASASPSASASATATASATASATATGRP
jgi:hypothetical protein